MIQLQVSCPTVPCLPLSQSTAHLEVSCHLTIPVLTTKLEHLLWAGSCTDSPPIAKEIHAPKFPIHPLLHMCVLSTFHARATDIGKNAKVPA